MGSEDHLAATCRPLGGCPAGRKSGLHKCCLSFHPCKTREAAQCQPRAVLFWASLLPALGLFPPQTLLDLTFSVCAAWSPGSREGPGGSRVGFRSPASSHLPPGVGWTPPCAPGPGSVMGHPSSAPPSGVSPWCCGGLNGPDHLVVAKFISFHNPAWTFPVHTLSSL